jgi:hypothetical protein
LIYSATIFLRAALKEAVTAYTSNKKKKNIKEKEDFDQTNTAKPISHLHEIVKSFLPSRGQVDVNIYVGLSLFLVIVNAPPGVFITSHERSNGHMNLKNLISYAIHKGNVQLNKYM